MIDVTGIPVADFVDTDTIRLISTAHIEEPALAPLAETEGDLDFLEEIEGLTSARRRAFVAVPAGLDPSELLTEAHGYGWTYINAAFSYTRENGNRFNGPERGAWYAAYGNGATQTAQAEVAWHLARELSYVGIYENVTAYRELLAGFLTRLHDLIGYVGQDFLKPDIDTAYPAGQFLADAILNRGGNGVLYPSARHAGGRCLAAFRPNLVQNVRQGQTWIFQWTGGPDPTISAA